MFCLTSSRKNSVFLTFLWHGLEIIFAPAQYLVAGYTLNCPSGETVINDMKEIGPTYYFAPPRVWENFLTQVMIRIEGASLLKKICLNFLSNLHSHQGSNLTQHN